MPIYEYRCKSCGFQKDHLQKLSDAPLTTCPSCGSNHYVKQISAPDFQLKGSGWYATDFKDGGNAANAAPSSDATPSPPCCSGNCACHPA
jgi:putative FmdB family regulatory protein